MPRIRRILFRWRTRHAVALPAAAGLVLAAAAVQTIAWRQPIRVGSGWIEPLANLLHALNAPGWAAAILAIGFPPTYGLGVTLSVTLISLACYAAVFWTARIVWRARQRRSEPAKEPDPSRRRLLLGGAAIGASAPVLTLAYATLVEPFDLRVRRYRVPIDGLPPAFHGLRVVQITDTHLGPRVPAWHIRDSVERALSLRPELIVLTGDYVHRGSTRVPESANLLAPLVASGVPVVGVLGNHDHYTGNPRRVRRELRRVGVHVLHNQSVYLAPNRTLRAHAEPGSLGIAGVDDLGSGEADPLAALADIPAETPRLLLSHNPDLAESAALIAPGSPRVDLMLSGHTHGGHVALPLLGRPISTSPFGQKYAHGLVRGPACPVLISAGVGMSILPVRLGVPPEIVLVELTPA